MSPLVNQERARIVPQSSDPTRQHWAMLLFESASAGVMAIFAGFFALSLVVGVYVIVVWPLTFWDLANLHLERYSSMLHPALWTVFALGTIAGYLCFSGAVFRVKPKVAASHGTRRR